MLYLALSIPTDKADALFYFDPRIGIFFLESAIRGAEPYVADILLQTYIKPTETEETHLCTGYVIPAGHSVMAWTNAGLQADQWVQVAVTGYLIDERKP